MTSNRTAVVTGGAVGIGRSIAERLAGEGAHVVIVDVQDGSEAVEDVRDHGGSAEFREGDVTSESSMERALAEVSDIDVVVNNAAYYAPLVTDKKRFDEISEDEWDTVFAVNAKGIFLTSKVALDRMTDGGSIVNISSGVVLHGTPGFLHYVGSKAAVLGITRAMANELGDLGIRVNAVMPGLVASEASKQAEDHLDTVADQQTLKRRLQPEDIADVVAFLASDDSAMITGQAVNVDGGFGHY